jgi:hypothetical protein
MLAGAAPRLCLVSCLTQRVQSKRAPLYSTGKKQWPWPARRRRAGISAPWPSPITMKNNARPGLERRAGSMPRAAPSPAPLAPSRARSRRFVCVGEGSLALMLRSRVIERTAGATPGERRGVSKHEGHRKSAMADLRIPYPELGSTRDHGPPHPSRRSLRSLLRMRPEPGSRRVGRTHGARCADARTCLHGRSEARPRAKVPERVAADAMRSSARPLLMRRSRRLHLHTVKQRKFLPSRRVAASGFMPLPLRTLVAADPDRGVAERREAPALHQVALVRRDATLVRGVGRPAQPGRRLSALHRGAVGPAPPVPGIAAGAGAKATRGQTRQGA